MCCCPMSNKNTGKLTDTTCCNFTMLAKKPKGWFYFILSFLRTKLLPKI